MPKLKTESEVATLAYLRTRTSVPVPTVYWFDANPCNVLGGEWIIMSKVYISHSDILMPAFLTDMQAQGLPLSKVYHTLSRDTLRALLSNLAALLIPLFGHRFPTIGSLYFSESTSITVPPPGTAPLVASSHPVPGFQIIPGPIISYPFFGSARGLLSHLTKPREIDRGPWATFADYLNACVRREIDGVIREGQGKQGGRRPRIAPLSQEGNTSSSSGSEEDDWGVDWNKTNKSETARATNNTAVGVARVGVGRPGGFGPSDFRFVDSDSDSDTESSSSSSSVGMNDDHESSYRDYRATQRSTFLVAHTAKREATVREEMGVFMEVMDALREEAQGGLGIGEVGDRKSARRRVGGEEDATGENEFTLDCHDLSLENVFVDEHDHTKIVGHSCRFIRIAYPNYFPDLHY